jgi:hypothetical protein
MFPLKSAATAKVLNCWISPSWSVTTKKILTAILKTIVSSAMMKKMKFIPPF